MLLGIAQVNLHSFFHQRTKWVVTPNVRSLVSVYAPAGQTSTAFSVGEQKGGRR